MTTPKRTGRNCLIFMAVAAALAPTAGLAAAAEAASDAAAAESSGLQEIVVTAERRSSNLQTTPIAVTAVDAQAMADLGPRTLGDIAVLVPNFSANKINGFNAASFAMRGVGNTDIIVYNEAPVSVLVDDFVMPSVQTQLLDPFDVESVEVLRGPQGTLFGKNTTGGAVIVRTKAPKLNETSFEIQGQEGSFDSYTVQGAFNIPIISDQLALRVVASQETEGGWMRNGASNTIGGTTYTGDNSRVGGTNVFTMRAKLLWQPVENFKTQFTYERLVDRSPSILRPGCPISLSPCWDYRGISRGILWTRRV
jgi:iron complex outermembrane recepter protein